MFFKHRTLWPLLLAFVVLLSGCDIQPEVPLATAKAKAEQCTVADDIEVVRRTHMDVIKHQRDKTMYQGIRTKQHSFKECINCHVPTEKAGKPVRVTDTQDHFCATCHSYVAVKLDCFECHSDRPEITADTNATAFASMPNDATHQTANIVGSANHPVLSSATSLAKGKTHD